MLYTHCTLVVKPEQGRLHSHNSCSSRWWEQCIPQTKRNSSTSQGMANGQRHSQTLRPNLQNLRISVQTVTNILPHCTVQMLNMKSFTNHCPNFPQ